MWRAVALLGLIGAAAGLPGAHAADDSCQLSASQKISAVKAFKGLAPIFQESRCLNCHGAVNPFSRTGGHGGGYIDIRKEAKDFLDSGDKSLSVGSDPDGSHAAKATAEIKSIADSPTEISDNDLIRQRAHDPMRDACKECHISSWIIPLKENHFVGRDWKQMCVHMKTSGDTNSPVRFLHHFEDDDLIGEAFKGRRGLLEAVAPKPPAMPRATVSTHANDWVAAMGGQFHDPPDCGCKTEGILLEVTHRLWTDPKSEASKVGSAQFDGTVTFDVLLTSEEQMPDGIFHGTASVVRPWLVRHVEPSFLTCAGTGSQNEEWQFFAMVDSDTNRMNVQFIRIRSDERASWTCTGHGVNVTDKVYPDVLGELESVSLSTASGTKKELNDNREHGAFERLSVTVIDNSAGK